MFNNLMITEVNVMENWIKSKIKEIVFVICKDHPGYVQKMYKIT